MADEANKVGDQPLAVSMLQLKEEQKDTTGNDYIALKVLDNLDAFYIKQEWEILEQISSWYEQKNHYTIFDGSGKVQLFQAREKTNCCFRVCCGENRPFRIKVYDTTGQKDKAALVFKRKYRCCGWAVIPCCAHRVDVHYMVDQNGNTIGKESAATKLAAIQVPLCHGGCCFPTWKLQDRRGKTQATIGSSNCCICDLCGGSFSVTDRSGKKVGNITKLAPKNLKQMALEVVSEADNFKVKFDKEMAPEIKMALIAATLQIDFTFFEDKRGPCELRCCDCWMCGFACPCCPAWVFATLCCCCDHSDKKKKKNAKDRRGAPAVTEMER